VDNDLFDALTASCKEVIEHKKGNLQLKTTANEMNDAEMEKAGYCSGK
jgi:hypothetical protein